ncbi:hypothetical protein DL93DRAFT_1211529 [Clavulina sp. PMI_390]|nr:hypothetical protein DL93DRAFT_1211529 [Clavulina sp. PMI_390]
MLGHASSSETFMQVYKPVIPHLHRCYSFWCFQPGDEIAKRIFPLPGNLSRLSEIYLEGYTEADPITIFAGPSSLSSLREMTINGLRALPMHNNPVENLVLGSRGRDMWAIPFLASSTKVTSLKLNTNIFDIFDEDPSMDVFLPNLRVFHHPSGSLIPFLDAPVLDELHWVDCWLGPRGFENPMASFPSLTRLHLYSPMFRESTHYLHDHERLLPHRFEFPQLTELWIHDSGEVAATLRALLLPHTIKSIRISPDQMIFAPLRYPALELVVLETTSPEELGELQDAVTTLLESYQTVKLRYNVNETFPQPNKWFWAQMKQSFGNRVFSVAG